MQAERQGLRAIEEIRGGGFLDVAAELVPRIGLGKDALAQAFGHIPAIPLLRDFKNQFIQKAPLVLHGRI